MHPVLKPGLRRLWRDPATVQLGVDPRHAVVLTGVDARVQGLLGLLDGTRDRAAVLAAATRLGLAAAEGARLLDLLVDAAVVDDAAAASPPAGMGLAERDRIAPDLAALSLRLPAGGAPAALRRRAGLTVEVVGAGRLGAPVAALLAAAGVGGVHVVDEEPLAAADVGPAGARLADIGLPRHVAAERAVRAVAPSTRTGAPARRPDFAVLAHGGALGAARRAAHLRDGVEHLHVAIRETTAVVGPLVLPGGSACARCLELTRADRDPGWPTLAAQLAGPPRSPHVAPCDTVLATLAAALAVLQVLERVDGGHPATVGGTLELALPDWRVRRRSWSVHPSCGCGWDGAR